MGVFEFGYRTVNGVDHMPNTLEQKPSDKSDGKTRRR